MRTAASPRHRFTGHRRVVAAVAGLDFDLRVVAAAAGMELDRAIDLVDVARADRPVVRLSDVAGTDPRGTWGCERIPEASIVPRWHRRIGWLRLTAPASRDL